MESETARAARRALGVVRIVNGGLGLLAPRFLLRRLGVNAEWRSSGVYPFRMFGIRTIVLGAELLLPDGDERRRVTRLAILIHGADTLSAVSAGLRGDLPRRAAVMATFISAGNTVLAFLSTRE
jgi:hypothetical protein